MEWNKKKRDVDDQFWDYAEATPAGFSCAFCSNAYVGSIGRIKWHLAKIEGHGIDICPEVDEDVVKQLREDYFHVRIEQPRRTKRERDCISSDLPCRKQHAANVKTAGVYLWTPEIVGGQFDDYIQDIWSCLMDDHVVFRIGIHGIGGVGKTQVAKHINNKLLRSPNKFDHVFWVNMSPDWSTSTSPPPRRVCDLQSCISKAVGVDLSEGDDETKRAAQLSKGLAEKKKSVLILDDVWDYFSLEVVGIPVGVDQCSVLFTTRSLELCRQLGCQEKIEIRCLEPDESYELFKKILGKGTTLSREVEEISRLVAYNCVGLPLAITIMARNMKGTADICQWRSALTGHIRKRADTEIFQKLKISYDYLKDTTLQHCFLCFPTLARQLNQIFTKYHMVKSRLVEYLVDEGIIPRMNTRREELDDAHTKLNFLRDVGLLEVGRWNVYMNEVIRRMALQIMEDNNQRAMIKNNMSLEGLPDEESWTGDLVTVSLQGNEIKSTPLHFSPSCPKLSTLSLSQNFYLGDIGGILFRGMPGLKVLDLSFTSIQSLPSSIDGLVNLTALLLSDCRRLVKFPSVGKLRALKKLDLSYSPVEVAGDIEMPEKLTYLDLCCTRVKLEPGVLAQLSRLQLLRLPMSFAIKGQEVACLSRLETLLCRFDDLVELNKYLVHLKGLKGREAPIQLDVSAGLGNRYRVRFANDLIYGLNEEEAYAAVEEDWSLCFLHDYNIINEADMLIYFQQIAIVKCREARSLCLFSPIKGATQLKYFSIRDCDGLELLCSLSLPGQEDILENLKYMELSNLKNLSVLFRKEANVAYGSCFSNLTRFLIEACPSIKRLFPIQLLKNLQRLYVLNCISMEEIFASAEEEEEATKFCLSQLCIVLLKDLPELRRVCGGRLTCVFPKSCSMEYMNCPKLDISDNDLFCFPRHLPVAPP